MPTVAACVRRVCEFVKRARQLANCLVGRLFRGQRAPVACGRLLAAIRQQVAARLETATQRNMTASTNELSGARLPASLLLEQASSPSSRQGQLVEEEARWRLTKLLFAPGMRRRL